MEMTPLSIGILIGIICAALGYFIGKKSKKSLNDDSHNYKSDLEVCKQRNNQLQSDIDALRLQIKIFNNDSKSNSIAADQSIENSDSFIFDAALAKKIFGKKVTKNDLKIVEGMGPKIEELFKTSGILTWKALGETSVERCNKILSKAGDRFSIHNPGTWPRQSKLAAEGKWQELKDWQDQLYKGKEK